MIRLRAMLRLPAWAAVGMALLAVPIRGLAHVTLRPDSAPGGSYFIATFVVPRHWIEIPTPGRPRSALREPAPFLELTARAP